jgi:uncharacterized protein YcbK (DUF882 family)
MGDISKNFSRWEFSCRCGCGFNAVDVELLEILERIRKHFGEAIHITCACRCLEHNRKVGSEDTSQHIRGMAADIWINDIKPEQIADYTDEYLLKGRGGIGKYDDFCHIDVRERIARWNKQNGKT